MEKKTKNNTGTISRIKTNTFISQAIITVLVFAFTNSLIYSIITLLASTIAIGGFVIMVKLVDKYFSKGEGKAALFSFMLFKFAIIAAIFYPVSKISETAVLFYILGLSAIVISTMIEGFYQIYRSFRNGT